MSEKKLPVGYVWFDTEYTSLNLDQAQLLQVAVMITDTQLNRILSPSRDLNFYVKISPNTPLSDWSKKNLSGLIEKCRSDEALTVGQIDKKVADYLDEHLNTPVKAIQRRPVMAGNSVHNDWYLARKFMPKFTERMHYRILDVSAMKLEWFARGGKEFDKGNPEMVRAYAPSADLGKLKQHDAYFDIIASVAELAYYRRHLFS